MPLDQVETVHVPTAIDDRVVNFHVQETDSDNIVMFAYENAGWIWTMTYDVINQVVVSAPARAFKGQLPVLTKDVDLRLFFIQDNQLKGAIDATPPSFNMTQHSAHEVLGFDGQADDDNYNVWYAGQYTSKLENTLPLRVDANTLLFYEGREIQDLPVGLQCTDTYDPEYVVQINDPEQIIVNADGQVGGAWNHIHDGTWNTNVIYPSPPLQVGPTGFAISMWLYGGSSQPLNSYHVYAYDANDYTVLDVRVPWSDGRVYWRAGNNGTSSYDDLNYAASAGHYKGKWTHWLFVKNVSSGGMWIYADNAQVASTTGKTRTFAPIERLYITPEYDGLVSEVVFIDKAPDAGERTAIYNRGLAGEKITAVDVANISHYWSFDPENGPAIEDKSTYDHHASVEGDIVTSVYGTSRTGDGRAIVNRWTPPLSMTIEAIITPRFNSGTCYILDGEVQFYYDINGRLFFAFPGALFGYTRGPVPTAQRRNHIAVSHVFGDGSTTFMAVNGTVLTAEWTQGTGAEAPVLDDIHSPMNLARDDVLDVLKISNVAKSISDIQDYIRGRT